MQKPSNTWLYEEIEVSAKVEAQRLEVERRREMFNAEIDPAAKSGAGVVLAYELRKLDKLENG